MEPMKWKFDISKVRGAMAELRMNQNELANEIDIAKNTMWNKLNGKTAFDVDEVCDLASVLNVPPSIFFTPDMCKSHIEQVVR